MLRALFDVFEEGDILLEDRYFGGWCDIALARRRGLDVVVRKHQLRSTDFRTGRRLGKKDHIISLPRVYRPKWMSPEQYGELPNELEVREVFVRVEKPGFRTEKLVVMTTLLDAGRISERRDRSFVQAAMAGGTESEEPEDGDEDGPTPL